MTEEGVPLACLKEGNRVIFRPIPLWLLEPIAQSNMATVTCVDQLTHKLVVVFDTGEKRTFSTLSRLRVTRVSE